MAIAPIFHGAVTDNLLMLDVHEAERRRQYLRFLNGKRVEMVLRPERSKRSLDQNAYLHTVPFPILAAEWGEDIETTKLLVLGEKFGWKETRDGNRLPMKAHTSQLTVDETSELIEWLPPWAMVNFGVVILLPNEAEDA